MKKLWIITLTFIMSAMLCFGLTACSTPTVDKLTNGLGALLEGGGFSEGSVLNLDKIEITEEQAADILDKLEDSGIAIDDEAKAYIYDIFVTKKNAKVQPDGTVKITVPAPEDEEAEGYNVYHVKDNGVIETIPAILADGKITFETDSFSFYVFVPTYNVGTITITPTEILYLGTDRPTECRITCDDKPILRQEVTARSVNENATVTVRAEYNENTHVFVGWFELEDEYQDVYHPILKSEPVSIESTYVFEMPMDGYALYAVVAPQRAMVEFMYDVRECSSATVNGKEISDGYAQKPMEIGNTYVFTAEANEGYEFCIWSLFGPFGKESFVEGETLEIVYDGTLVRIMPRYNPKLLGLEIEQNRFVYDPALLEEYESIGIAEFNAICEEGKDSENWNKEYVITGKIKRIENTTWGNMALIDSVGNELHIYGLYDENGRRYGLMEDKPAVGDVIAVHGAPYLYDGEPEMKKAYLLDALSELPNFERLVVYVTTVEGKVELSSSEYTVDVGTLDVTKPGEYTVIFTYKQDPTLQATVTVEVLAGAPVNFSAWAEGGTLLLDGVDIGPDIYETFEDGFGKLTLTAVGEENTVFKGWYTLDDSSDTAEPILISTDATYTFEFNEDTAVYAAFEHLASDMHLDGVNMGFDTDIGVTEIFLPIGDYIRDPSRIMVFVIRNGERELLSTDEYTIDLGGFNSENPAKGDYTVTFTYKENTDIKATHVIRVIDEENMVCFYASSAPGGYITYDKPYSNYNKGDSVTVTVNLRSEKDYEFVGWYTVDASGAVGENCLSTDRTYTVTLNESVYLYAKIEPRITYLNVEVAAYPHNPAKIHLDKFIFETRVLACGALGTRIELTSDQYTVDKGGLDVNNPAVGKYTLIYTYNADTSIKYELVVWVWDTDHSFLAWPDSPDNGYVLYNGELSGEAGDQLIDGEEVTVAAVPKEGYNFIGWYKVIDMDTHREYELVATSATYTFTITEDVRLEARFGAPITELELRGVPTNDAGNYTMTINKGDIPDLSGVDVWGYSLIGAELLAADVYEVDLGGLDGDVSTGTYSITYTLKENSSVMAVITVKVTLPVYEVIAVGIKGKVYCNGNNVTGMVGSYEDGTVLTFNAVNLMEDVVFIGWQVFSNMGEWLLISNEREINVIVYGDMRIRAIFECRKISIICHKTAELDVSRVDFWHVDENIWWNEEYGWYEGYADVNLYKDSVYVDDITEFVKDLIILTMDMTGNIENLYLENMTVEIEYGSLDEEGFATYLVKIGNIVIRLNVWVIDFVG